MFRDACLALVLVPLVAAASQNVPPQLQRPVFRGGTQLVRVDAYPAGKDGRIIEGLTAGDFEIFEDGKPQKVETFDFERFEMWTPDAERRDPRTQQEAYDLAADPAWRVFVIVIDRQAYDMEGQRQLRAPLHQFIERNLGPHDLFGLLTTDNEWTDLVLGQETTVAGAVLDSREWLDSAYQERLYVDSLCGGTRKRLDDTYSLLEGLIKMLGMIREERKSIIFVSNELPAPGPSGASQGRLPMAPLGPRGHAPVGTPAGMPVGPTAHGDRIASPTPAQNCEAERFRVANIDFQRRLHDLLSDARQANVAFYPVSARGLEAPPLHLDQLGPVSVRQTMADVDAIRHRNDTLLTLAENTDGLAIVNTNDLAAGVRRIAEDVHAYYILGYYPTNSKWDGTVRTIKVRLKSTGKTIRARHQYRAPTEAEVTPAPVRPDPVPQSVREALNRLAISVERDSRGVDAPTAAAASGTLVSDAIARRRGAQEAIRTLVFDRTEQIRLEWPARSSVDHVDARVLDRMGHPLAAPIPVMLDASRTPATVVAELPLAAFAGGDYVVELTAVSGGNNEHRFVAFRVR